LKFRGRSRHLLKPSAEKPDIAPKPIEITLPTSQFSSPSSVDPLVEFEDIQQPIELRCSRRTRNRYTGSGDIICDGTSSCTIPDSCFPCPCFSQVRQIHALGSEWRYRDGKGPFFQIFPMSTSSGGLITPAPPHVASIIWPKNFHAATLPWRRPKRHSSSRMVTDSFRFRFIRKATPMYSVVPRTWL
jgi:hypothetical protein